MTTKDHVRRALYLLCLLAFLGGIYVSLREHATSGILVMALAALTGLSIYSSDETTRG